MPKKLYKILLIIGITLALLVIPFFALSYNPPRELEVDFLDIGQGDAILIKAPAGQNILIDGGPDNTVVAGLSENLPFWDRQIDLMVLTHPHDDHVTGLIDVLKRYRVKKILYTGVIHDSPNFLEWLELVREKKIPVVIIDRPQTVTLGEASAYLDILYPRTSLLGRTVSNLNNSSIVIKLVYGQTDFLLTGDAEVEVEQELLTGLSDDAGIQDAGTQNFVSPPDLRAEVLKVGHHGSDTSSSEEFLQAVRPQIAVIQVGVNNDFGHPSRRVIKRLERIGVKIFRNDLDGTVRLFSNGREIY